MERPATARRTSSRYRRLVCCVMVLAASSASVGLAEEPAADGKATKVVEQVTAAQPSESEQDQVNKANNPLANLIAVNLHNYYSPRLNGIPDESANAMWLRMVTPYWRLIPRVSLPIQVAPVADTSTTPTTYNTVTGIGDLNIFATFVVTPDESPAMLGVGPIYTAPTASNDALGAGKHQIGLAALTVWSKGVLLLGGLVNYQIGVGGDSSKPRTQFIGAQPFMFLQLGNGYYLIKSLESAPFKSAHFFVLVLPCLLYTGHFGDLPMAKKYFRFHIVCKQYRRATKYVGAKYGRVREVKDNYIGACR